MRLNELTKLGAVCVIATVATGCSVLPASVTNAFKSTKEITAEFENVAGMYVGNEVEVLGMPVGTIDSIEPKGDIVVVKMTVDGDVKLPADVRGAAVSPSAVTNRHVELTPAYSGEGPTLADGDTIPRDRTRVPVDIDRVLKTLDRIASDLQGTEKGTGAPGPLSGRILYNTLNGNGDKLRDTIQALATTLKLGVDNRDAVSNTITRLNELTTIVAENDQSLRDFSSNLTSLTALLADQAPGLQAVLGQLNDFLTNTATVLADNKDQLTSSLTNLTETANLLRDNARNLTEVVDVTPLLFQNIKNSVSYEERRIRAHLLADKGLLDSDLIGKFCEKVQMRADGCRTGRLKDFGPDFGLTAAMLGVFK
ncbi:MCE family protein [Antrihabitans stalactiti]|jgi:phospholipid/cholesterol/gamma-HCH transport system substrate-binding protein|uniref:MCE family protein n=1 Tax=Antrihabitans stalactiti TaxID=2584121 RepID=A0A848K991_9NOCA|nr:MCE family protein [Antrihabitans stalactiti]NMN95383.1 MCE family protein [Antrihabitans stalactiti]